MLTERICIPIPHKSQGGMYTFLDNWRRWLTDYGIAHTDDPQADFDVLFVNSWVVPYGLISQIKKSRPHVRVVQRVDGSGRDYGRVDDADDRQARVNMLADLTIFQSNYSKYITTKKLKVIRQDGPIIYNPVDLQMFHPDETLLVARKKPSVCNVSYSLNPKKGTAQIGSLGQQYRDIRFVLCGRYPAMPDLPNVQQLGYLNRSELAKVMRSCHVLLHLAEKEACPNVVLEALASGLPVLFKDSGGTPELVGKCGAPVTPDSFGRQLEMVMKNYYQLTAAARDRAVHHFSPDIIFSQYLRAIEEARRRPLPSKINFVQAAREGYPVLPRRPRQLYWWGRRWLINKFKTG